MGNDLKNRNKVGMKLSRLELCPLPSLVQIIFLFSEHRTINRKFTILISMMNLDS